LFLGDDFDLLGYQRDYVTIQETDIRNLQFMAVDLAPLFTPATKETLLQARIEQEFWIAPPPGAWPYNATRTFRPFSVPFLELRRHVSAHQASGKPGFVKYTRTEAKANLVIPWLWRHLGKSNLAADVVTKDLVWDATRGGDLELELPLPWWQQLLTRFRPFDVNYSPCRH